MSEEKKNRQQLACDYIHENYVAFNRLRYDLIAQKVQVCEERWRYITNADINSIVCDCCAETGANITAKEILTVLNAGSSYIPRVHPLRDYVLSLKPYSPDQPDWIDMVARQVHVKGNDKTENLINDNIDNLRGNQLPAALKENIPCRSRDIDSSGTLSKLSSKHIPVGCRSAADVEQSLTQLLLQTQESHEEIILEVTDFRPGTEYGYNTPCPSELQKP